MPGITLSELLKKMIEMGGSDLHITTNSAPRVRVHGRLRPLDMPPLSAADTKSLAYSVLTDAQKHRFEENLELDFSFGLKNLARFRGNVFNQRGAVGAVFQRPRRMACGDRLPSGVGQTQPETLVETWADIAHLAQFRHQR